MEEGRGDGMDEDLLGTENPHTAQRPSITTGCVHGSILPQTVTISSSSSSSSSEAAVAVVSPWLVVCEETTVVDRCCRRRRRV